MPAASVETLLAELNGIQDAAGRGDRPDAALKRARGLISHADNDVRWQALIALGEWIRSRPDVVWEVVLEHGQSEDEDMRAVVATILLEHPLEHHFADYFPLLRERIEGGAPLLAHTLGTCWPFGEAEPHWNEVRSLLKRNPRGPDSA